MRRASLFPIRQGPRRSASRRAGVPRTDEPARRQKSERAGLPKRRDANVHDRPHWGDCPAARSVQACSDASRYISRSGEGSQRPYAPIRIRQVASHRQGRRAHSQYTQTPPLVAPTRAANGWSLALICPTVLPAWPSYTSQNCSVHAALSVVD